MSTTPPNSDAQRMGPGAIDHGETTSSVSFRRSVSKFRGLPEERPGGGTQVIYRLRLQLKLVGSSFK